MKRSSSAGPWVAALIFVVASAVVLAAQCSWRAEMRERGCHEVERWGRPFEPAYVCPPGAP